MNNDFPRILTLLRKERGLSQKKVAIELNISQALLSHYEKGIRECGLDFVLRTANFYDVSCDYLLGRSPHRTGSILSVEHLTNNQTSHEKILLKGGVLTTLNKKVIVNSLEIIFDLLQQINQKKLTIKVSEILMLTTYRLFRLLYHINPKNEHSLFVVSNNVCPQLVQSSILKAEAACISSVESLFNKRTEAVDMLNLVFSTDILDERYPQLSTSLFNLIRMAEQQIKDSSIDA